MRFYSIKEDERKYKCNKCVFHIKCNAKIFSCCLQEFFVNQGPRKHQRKDPGFQGVFCLTWGAPFLGSKIP